jgi:hypothetical protein
MATPIEQWIEEQTQTAQPRKIYWCDGSEGEAYCLLEIGMNEEWMYPRTDDVCPSLHDGTSRFPLCPSLYPDNRQHIGGGEHANHDQDGESGSGQDRKPG